MAKSRKEVNNKYMSIYYDAFDEVVDTFRIAGVLGETQLKLTPINDEAIAYWKAEWMGRSRRHKHGGDWDWERIVKKSLKRFKKFDLAIWGDGVLCGLTIGLVTRGRKNVRLNYLQACPVKHPLETLIASIAVSVAIAVAQRVGAEHVAMCNPVNDKVEEHYRKLGFERKSIYGRHVKNAMYKNVPRRG
ncbi:hypothetical protein ACSHDQ_003434 [Edwardsiella ictaluri]